MARLICVEYAGATYHVMGRGNPSLASLNAVLTALGLKLRVAVG